jgi:hypothetical protein
MRTAVVILLASCGNAGDAPAPATAPAPPAVAAAPAPADAASLKGLPASSRASIASPPRDRWACGFKVDEHQGMSARGLAVFRYGKRTSCRIPISLVAQGVWGCPDSYDRTDTDGMVRSRALAYDDHDRIITFDVQVRETFTWDGDRLAETAREQWGASERATYRDRDNEVIAVDDDGREQEVHVLDGSHVTRSEEFASGYRGGVATIDWRNDRPQRVGVDVTGPIKGSVEREFIYGCEPTKAPASVKFVKLSDKGIVVRITNPTAKPIGAFSWQVRYYDLAVRSSRCRRRSACSSTTRARGPRAIRSSPPARRASCRCSRTTHRSPEMPGAPRS